MVHILLNVFTAILIVLAALIIGDLVMDIFALRGEAKFDRNNNGNRTHSCNRIHTIDSENTDNIGLEKR